MTYTACLVERISAKSQIILFSNFPKTCANYNMKCLDYNANN